MMVYGFALFMTAVAIRVAPVHQLVFAVHTGLNHVKSLLEISMKFLSLLTFLLNKCYERVRLFN